MAKISARRLVGWLLRANRVLSEVDRGLRSGKEFARLFRTDQQAPLAASYVTRWEQGRLAVTRTTIRRYERMLEFSPDSLLTVCDVVRRSEVVPYQSSENPLGGVDEDLFKRLLDQALHGAPMSGFDWASLAEIVHASPGLYLFPTENWTALTSRLLEELVVADHREWLLRQEAMSKFLEHPYAAAHAVKSCIDVVGDSSSAAVLEPMSLLDVSATSAANSYVLNQLVQPSDERVLYAAAVAARQKTLRGHFDAAQVRRVIAAATHHIRDGAAGDLLAALQPLTGSVRQPTPRHKSPTHTIHEVSERIALCVHGSLAAEREDPLLSHVVDQALFAPESDERMISAMCLAATPYQTHVGAALMSEIHTGLASRDEYLPLKALRTLTTLAVDLHRPLVLRILTTPGFSPNLREAAAWALPHCAGRYSETTWRDLLASYSRAWRHAPTAHLARVLHGIAYGIGTDDYYTLADEIRTDPSLPTQARKVAAWLHRTRPASVLR